MIALAALLLTAQPSPVLVTTVRPGRPLTKQQVIELVTSGTRMSSSSDDKPLTTLGVRVFAGSRLLLADRLRLTNNVSSQNSRSEAPPQACPSDRYGGDDNSSVEFSVYRQKENQMRVSLNWRRPSSASCDAGRIGVSLEQSIDLGPGETIVLTADADVRVELTRD